MVNYKKKARDLEWHLGIDPIDSFRISSAEEWERYYKWLFWGNIKCSIRDQEEESNEIQ